MAKIEDAFRRLQDLVNDDLPETIFNGGTADRVLEAAQDAQAALTDILQLSRAAIQDGLATMLVKAFVDFAIKRGRKRLPPGIGEEGQIEPDFDFLHTAFAEFNIARNAGGS